MTATRERTFAELAYGPTYEAKCGVCGAGGQVYLREQGRVVLGRVVAGPVEERLFNRVGYVDELAARCSGCLNREAASRDIAVLAACRFCWTVFAQAGLLLEICPRCDRRGEPPSMWWQRDAEGRLLAATIIGMLAMHGPLRASELRRKIGGDAWARPWQRELQLWPWMLDELVMAGYIGRAQEDTRRGFQTYGAHRHSGPSVVIYWPAAAAS